MAFYEYSRDLRFCNVESFLTRGTDSHFHSTIEILLVKKGSIELTLNGKISLLSKGDIVFCNSFDIHAYKIIEPDTVGLVWVIPKGQVKNYSASLSGKKFINQVFRDKQCFKELIVIFEMMKKYSETAIKNIDLINSLGQSVFALVTSRLKASEKSAPETDIMKDVLLYLYDNFTEELSLETVSVKFGYTPNHFSFIFNNYMHISLTSFINNLRTEHSAFLLKKGMSVIDASENSGFGSLRTFYRCFKEKYKVSPVKFASGSDEKSSAEYKII